MIAGALYRLWKAFGLEFRMQLYLLYNQNFNVELFQEIQSWEELIVIGNFYVNPGHLEAGHLQLFQVQ